MKASRLITYIYSVNLLLFGIISASFWSDYEKNDNTLNLLMTIMLQILSFTILFLYLRQVKVKEMKGSVLIAVLWIFCAPIVLFMAHTQSLITDSLSVILWPIVFLCSYILVKNNRTNFYVLQKFFVILWFITLLYFVGVRLSEYRNANMVFFPLMTTPWIMSIKKIRLRNIFLLVLFIAVLFSSKRSAIIAFILILISYYFSYFARGKSLLRGVVLVLLLIISVGIFYQVNKMFDNAIIERFNSVEEDQGSGRLFIYQNVLDLQVRSTKSQYLWGHGHFAVKKDSLLDLSAHNDFLEILYDYGIIIFTLYILLWINIIKQLIRLRKNRSVFFFPYFSSIVLFIIVSMVSHLVLYASNFIFLVCFWGAVQGIVTREKLENKTI